MAKAEKFRRFADWKTKLLRNRGFESPDGRELYLYRLTDDEFLELEEMLRELLGRLLPVFGLAKVADLTGFAALFVLYASEWWRRRYDGSGFSWEPILRDLGADPNEWSPGQRSEFVQHGLRDWRLKPRESGALRFLGAVAVQGGLPLKLLATARGGIGHLLSRVLQLAAGSQITQADLQTWVESLSVMLPKSYRQGAIYTLLTDVAWTVLKLKQEAGLTTSADAIAILDNKIVGWRERFPLPVDDVHAQGMIEQLVRDAANVRIERRKVFLPLDRFLEQDETGDWTLRSRLLLPDAVKADEIGTLFDISLDDLPRAAELALIVNNQAQTTSMRRMAGNDSYRLERKPWGFSREEAAREHVLRMTAPDGRVWSVTATKGESLDENLAWVFVADGSSYQLFRQGSGSVALTEALVAMPVNWHIEPEIDSECIDLGQLEIPLRCVYRGKGIIKAQRNGGLVFRLRTGYAGATEEHYQWRGNRYWLGFHNPDIAFKGLPHLYRVDDEGLSRKMEGQVSFSVAGGENATQAIGPTTLRYPSTGDIKHRCRMVLLPTSADLKMEYRDAMSGAIHLEGWKASSARVVAPEVRQQLHSNDDGLVLEMAALSGNPVPDNVEIEVFWYHTAVPAKLTVPFPSKGVRAFDGAGREMRNGALLAVQQIAGIRLLVSGGQNTAEMFLEISTKHNRTMRRHKLRTLPGAVSLQVRLQDYMADIHHLMSIDDSPDTRVKVDVTFYGVKQFSLILARYAAPLDKEVGDVLLGTSDIQMMTTEELEVVPVFAIRLEHPGDEPLVLPACTSEGVVTGAWCFSPELREPGAWLIYPGPEAQLPFRPTLWPVGSGPVEGNGLTFVMGIPDTELRKAAIDQVIAAMAADFDDPSWTNVEQLVAQVGHLPLTTLDVWRRFAHSPQGMAALAFRFSNMPGGFYTRFSQELPFAWETVPFLALRGAMECLKNQCMTTFGDDAGSAIFRSHLDARVNELSAMNGALAFLLGVAHGEFDPAAKQKVQLLRIIGAQVEQRLFEGEKSPLMALRRSHAEDDWPTDFNDILSKARYMPLISEYLYFNGFGHHDGVINMPLMFAACAASNQTEAWIDDTTHIHALRSYRAFDTDWFDEAYNQTVARCLAAGLLDHE